VRGAIINRAPYALSPSGAASGSPLPLKREQVRRAARAMVGGIIVVATAVVYIYIYNPLLFSYEYSFSIRCQLCQREHRYTHRHKETKPSHWRTLKQYTIVHQYK